MKKNHYGLISGVCRTWESKFLKRMRIVALLILISITQTFALDSYAQNKRLSFDVKNETIINILEEIEDQSEFYFMFDASRVNVNQRKTVDCENQLIENILDQLFKNTGITYSINDRQVLLTATEKINATQQKSVSGKVSDQSGLPLPGVTVAVKGTSQGTVTDFEGNFSLTNISNDATLIFSFIGMKTLEIPVAEKTTINIKMIEEATGIEEIVAIGYGTARKADLTGAVANVQGASLLKRSTQQISTAMQGQMAGVQVTRSSGAPGATATVRIRGITTLSNNNPLVIVDGVPSSLNDVVASDVESMTVLKDAASASIYGSRAAAGVILITTKRAKDGQFSLDYNYEYAFDKPTAKPKNGDVIDWMNVMNEIRMNDSGTSDPYSVYSKELIDSWLDNHENDPWHYPNTDWVNLMLKKNTSHQQHSLSVSGGTERSLTKFNFNYQESEGYYVHRSYERFAGRLNNDTKITDWLDANIDINFSKSETVSPAKSGLNVIYRAYQTSPYYNAYWEDGRYADVKDGSNNLASLNEGGTHSEDLYRFGGKAQLNITPLKGLTFKAVFAPRFSFIQAKNFVKEVEVYYEDGTAINTEFNQSTDLSETRNSNNSKTYQFYGNYQNKWGGHSLNAMAGYEGYTYSWNSLGASRNNYLLDSYPYLNVGPEDYQYNSGSAGHNAYESVFGRLMYSFKNKYLLQGNVRSDGSSRFAKDYRWGTFYSGSVGWVMSEESWFNLKSVDFLKIRGSIGQLGNERIGSEFPYQASMSFGNSYMYDKPTQSVLAMQLAAQTHYAFENITWETTTTYGVGVDFSLLNSRLSFTGDYYYKKTSDMLLTLGFPAYSGFSAPDQNAGDMHTKGWDVELGWSDNVGDFWYNISVNMSDYRSKMGYLGDKRTINGNTILEKGSYFNEWFMYQADGLFQTDADLFDEEGNKYPTLTANDKAGNIKYVDTDGNGTINSDDKVRLGNSLPEYIYGGNISMGWKEFDFNLTFQGIGHQRVLFNRSWIQPLKEQWGAVPSLVLDNYWSQHNTAEQNLNAKYPRLTYNNTTNTFAGSDYWLFNGAYFRVKNITLGYTLPDHEMTTKFLKSLRFYVSVTDLPAISNYPKQWDPEVGYSSDFISTSLILGVNVKF